VINNLLNEDSQAMLLISSSLGITHNEKEKIKAYTLTEWNKLATKLLSSELKSPKGFFHTSPDEWKSSLRMTDDEVERLKVLLNNGAQLAFELDNLGSSGIWITTRAESNYPTLLKERLKQKCPVFLYCAGNSSLFKTKGVGIVGSRDIDQRGLDFTKMLSARCTFDGYSIVSGGAKGVDSVAQDIALQNDGTVISIVSDSMASKIRMKENRESIMKNKLLMVSLAHPNMTFKVYNAMERNKYIYALSQFAVAVSSDYNKGGTWAGATEDLKNNWVPLFVRKEVGIPKGNSKLLEIGAFSLEKDEVLNRNVSIEDWLSKDRSNIHDANKEKQLTLKNIIDQAKNIEQDDSKKTIIHQILTHIRYLNLI